MSSITNTTLDELFKTFRIGSVDKAISNNLFGINATQVKSAVQSNRDNYGFTFFVRPQLNLQSSNIRNHRIFYSMLTQQSVSIQRYVRCMLDPRMQTGYTFNKNSIPAIQCPLVDPLNPFIPVLTNNLLSISGWPDITVDTFTSKPGLYRENYAQVDGIAKNYEAFDLDASFRNTRGDPIIFLFYIWLNYMADVFEGKLVPYMDFIKENEIDYNTRIFRLILDESKTFVTKIASSGPAIPISNPTSSFFDYNHEIPFNDQNDKFTIRFKCLGVTYFDSILIKEFNDTGIIFNPSMKDGIRENRMVKLSKISIELFKNRAYPRINPDNNELEWWVTNQLFATVTKQFVNSNRDSIKDLQSNVGD